MWSKSLEVLDPYAAIMESLQTEKETKKKEKSV